MELCDVKARPDAGELTEQFWLTPIGQAQHPNIASVAKTLLTIFGSTYICESAFSTCTDVYQINAQINLNRQSHDKIVENSCVG